MEPGAIAVLQALLERRTAALGTLHEGEPFVSMVPFAPLGAAEAFVVHVSGLAAHTKDMRAHPRVSLLIAADEASQENTLALPRITLQGTAVEVDPAAPGYPQARAAYLARFPEAEPLFGFGDFALFAIRPATARFVGGFAQAKTLTAQGLMKAVAG